MENHNKHTARYQLSRFLQSEYGMSLPLIASDIAILTTMFDFMDSGDLEMCFACYDRISKIAHVTKRTIISRLPILVKFKIITKSRGQYSSNICIGNAVKREVK